VRPQSRSSGANSIKAAARWHHKATGACCLSIRCAHLLVTLLHQKKLLSIVQLVLNSRAIRATMLIEIKSFAQKIAY